MLDGHRQDVAPASPMKKKLIIIVVLLLLLGGGGAGAWMFLMKDSEGEGLEEVASPIFDRVPVFVELDPEANFPRAIRVEISGSPDPMVMLIGFIRAAGRPEREPPGPR